MKQRQVTEQCFCDICGVTVPAGWWCWIVETPAEEELLACTHTCREVAEIEPEARQAEIDLDVFDGDMSFEQRQDNYGVIQDWINLRNRLGDMAAELEPAEEEVW